MVNSFVKTIFIFTIFLFLQSCSWVNSFYIINATSKTISLEFSLSDSSGTFPIFYNGNAKPAAYKLTNGGSPDYNQPTEVKKELLGSSNYFKIILPSKIALQIGALQNDKYTSHKQYFINGRVFNLKSFTIIKETESKIINPDQFDSNLKKEDGDFIFRVE